ncbi:TylF/MycF family methyltransferase [Actinomadura fibrosa]|uniref:TylF/MycF family methyltransferase n=2 Tax=Actinomadura fibrosa TaxID=111802 RepID=A0ABW2XVW2_9ACTN
MDNALIEEAPEGGAAPEPGARDLYLRLLKRTLANVIYEDAPNTRAPFMRGEEFDLERRTNGADWPRTAHTMIGLKRLDNLQYCVEEVLADGVPGDLIETGVWRGGACILMRGVLAAHGVTDRRVWVADSFEGMPDTEEAEHAVDRRMRLDRYNDVLAVPLDEVRANFARYGLLDDRVGFLRGWFRDTLPTAPVDRLAVLRLDGDLYDSTTDALRYLYPKLSAGGFVIVDDYRIPSCREAVHDYRQAHGIEDEIVRIDRDSVFWRRTG